MGVICGGEDNGERENKGIECTWGQKVPFEGVYTDSSTEELQAYWKKVVQRGEKKRKGVMWASEANSCILT